MSSKKLYILNPHRDDFIWEPLYYRILKRRPLRKYHYIDEVLRESGQVVLVIDDRSSGIFPQSFLNALPSFLRRKLIAEEIRRWRKINEIPSTVNMVWTHETLTPSPEDNLLLFQLCNLHLLPQLQTFLSRFQHCYVHLSHYYLRPKEISSVLEKIPNVYCCGDSDVSEHPFFKKYFPWYKKSFVILPFYVQDRFQCTIPYEKKENKILSTGTFHPIEDYRDAAYLKTDWGVEAFHHNRRSLYEHREENIDITCMNSPWLQKDTSWYMKLFNARKVSQKKYFSIDIVEMYNKHRYALIGEEICGFPGIGSFEAMACGCVVLMNPNTLKGICEDSTCYHTFTEKVTGVKVEEISDNIPHPFEISQRAIRFVDSHLRRDSCMKKFYATFL